MSRLIERARFWLVCGPLGHLWSALADLALFGARSALRRLRAARRRTVGPASTQRHLR